MDHIMRQCFKTKRVFIDSSVSFDGAEYLQDIFQDKWDEIATSPHSNKVEELEKCQIVAGAYGVHIDTSVPESGE
jgi:hypothetical protein